MVFGFNSWDENDWSGNNTPTCMCHNTIYALEEDKIQLSKKLKIADNLLKECCVVLNGQSASIDLLNKINEFRRNMHR